jgi:hypothetical protein
MACVVAGPPQQFLKLSRSQAKLVLACAQREFWNIAAFHGARGIGVVGRANAATWINVKIGAYNTLHSAILSAQIVANMKPFWMPLPYQL